MYGLRFPKLVNTGETTTSLHDEELTKYHLDWSELDESKRKHQESWYMKHLYNLTEYERDIFLNRVLPKCDWDAWNRPVKYDYVSEKIEYLYITDHYYKEIMHFKELGNSEWKRNRPFDTYLREMCLEPANAYISMYFNL